MQLRLPLLLLCCSCMMQEAEAACGDDQYYATGSECSNWRCSSLPSSNHIRYCLFTPTPQICNARDCRYFDANQNVDASTCLDETIVCKKGYYAPFSPQQTCMGRYSGNGGQVPFMETLFICIPCPYGYFCRGGALHTSAYRSNISSAILMYPFMHRPPSVCPYGNMVGRSDLALYDDVCGSYVNGPYCNEQIELQNQCTMDPRGSKCPCECKPNTNTFLVRDPSHPGGKSCGCSPGIYWDTLVSPYVINCTTACELNAFCPGGPMPNYKFLCPSGWKTVDTGSSSLLDCKLCHPACLDGMYCSLPESVADSSPPCKPCPPGHSCSGGIKTACPAGYFQDGNRSISCKSCDAGLFSKQPGSTACASCPPGTYSGSKSSTACMLCPPGEGQPNAGKTACEKCAAGSYQPMPGSTTCISCPEGTIGWGGFVGQVSMLDACRTCDPGTMQTLSRKNNDNKGVYECVHCPPGELSAHVFSLHHCRFFCIAVIIANECRQVPAHVCTDLLHQLPVRILFHQRPGIHQRAAVPVRRKRHVQRQRRQLHPLRALQRGDVHVWQEPVPQVRSVPAHAVRVP